MKLFITILFVWCINILFGAVVFNTIVLYPNFFRDIPESLELTMAFMKVRGPAHFFPPFGSTVILLNAITLFLWWRNKKTRYPLGASLLFLVIFEFIFSVLYFWKLNTILFIEGTAFHSIGHLQKTASNFQFWHWIRFGTTGGAALLSLFALVNVSSFDRQPHGDTVSVTGNVPEEPLPGKNLPDL